MLMDEAHPLFASIPVVSLALPHNAFQAAL